jgi:hypothetical protein
MESGGRPGEDLQERQPCGVVPQLAGCRPGRRRGVGQLAEEFVELGHFVP